jgi:hypothetical protein
MQGLFAMRVWSKSGKFRSALPRQVTGLKIRVQLVEVI